MLIRYRVDILSLHEQTGGVDEQVRIAVSAQNLLHGARNDRKCDQHHGEYPINGQPFREFVFWWKQLARIDLLHPVTSKKLMPAGRVELLTPRV